MPICTPCVVSHCITAPTDCAPGSPGGWQQLWFLNRCQVESFQFEALGNQSRGRVLGATLLPGSSLKTFSFYKRTGLQFDTEALDENGFRYTHTVTVPVAHRDADTLATLREMVGAELVFIGLHRDGRYYIAGLGDEGFQLQRWADAKGRLATDAALMEVVFSLVDMYPQLEFLAGTPGDSLETRKAATRSLLEALTNCAATPPTGGSGDVDMSLDTVQLVFTEGTAQSYTVTGRVYRNGCTESLSVVNLDGLPDGLSLSLPVALPAGTDTFSFTVAYSGAAVPGNSFSFRPQVNTTACGAGIALVQGLVFPA